ncbi:MAG: PQQ-binding-like beta-propeller repeat protein [Spirochaetales bacterium]|nr:PQQ-binding-like beta-propeller repeat protein [Spirochaetales bacterium]
MNERQLYFSTVFLITLLASLLILWWLHSDPPQEFYSFTPGLDNKPETLGLHQESVRIGAFFQEFDGIPSAVTAQWPRFRGPEYDNINRENIPLIDSWAGQEPEILWKIDLGEGHAGPAVANGSVYIMDYDEDRKADTLRRFSLDTGKEIWRRWYSLPVKRNHGISRSIPAVSDSFVVSMGPLGHVMCVDAHTGDFLWGIDLEKEYATIVPAWYTAQCPVIDNNIAVIAPAGTSLMIGVACETGEVLWETKNTFGWKMSHSSIMPMSIDGVPMYVYSALGGLCGIAARGEKQGEILWSTTAWNNAVIAPSPVIFPDNRIFLTAGYGAGSMMLKVIKKGDIFSTEVLYATQPRQGLSCEQQTPVLYDGHLFGVLPKDAGPFRNQFICYDPDGRIVWTSGKDKRFGLGPYLLGDGKFFILRDDGILFMVKASISEYDEFDSVQILSGRDAWGPLALVNGMLLARDSRQLVCINIAAESR